MVKAPRGMCSYCRNAIPAVVTARATNAAAYGATERANRCTELASKAILHDGETDPIPRGHDCVHARADRDPNGESAREPVWRRARRDLKPPGKAGAPRHA